MAPAIKWSATTDAKYLKHALSQHDLSIEGDSTALFYRMTVMSIVDGVPITERASDIPSKVSQPSRPISSTGDEEREGLRNQRDVMWEGAFRLIEAWKAAEQAYLHAVRTVRNFEIEHNIVEPSHWPAHAADLITGVTKRKRDEVTPPALPKPSISRPPHDHTDNGNTHAGRRDAAEIEVIASSNPPQTQRSAERKDKGKTPAVPLTAAELGFTDYLVAKLEEDAGGFSTASLIKSAMAVGDIASVLSALKDWDAEWAEQEASTTKERARLEEFVREYPKKSWMQKRKIEAASKQLEDIDRLRQDISAAVKAVAAKRTAAAAI